MDLIQTASTALMGWFSSSRKVHTPQTKSPLSPPLSSFPQFSQLPIELRLKIWNFAANPRVLRIHLHHYSPEWLYEEDRFEGYAQDEPELQAVPFDGPNFEPDPESPYFPFHTFNNSTERPHHMVITPCVATHPCHCGIYPPKSHHAVSPPGAFFACRESHDLLANQYVRCLEDEYDTRGFPVINPTSRIQKSPSSLPPVTGLIFNPSVDSILIRANVASCTAIQYVSHFVAIAARQIPDVRKVIFELQIAMPPYKFWSSARFQYWRKWGETGWWVPTRSLVKIRGLREVVLVRRKGERMLPAEWKSRTEGQWVEELLKVRETWPGEWEGRMPSLKCVLSLAEAEAM